MLGRCTRRRPGGRITTTSPANNWIYWDYAFGTAAKTFPDLTVPSTADAAIRNWRASAAPVAAWLAKAKPADLDESRPNHLGQDLRAGHIVGILLDELVHTAPRSHSCGTCTFVPAADLVSAPEVR